MWAISIIFFIPAIVELVEPNVGREMAIIWMGIAICFNPAFPASDKSRVTGVCFFFSGFALVALMSKYQLLTGSMPFVLLLGLATAVLLTLANKKTMHSDSSAESPVDASQA